MDTPTSQVPRARRPLPVAEALVRVGEGDVSDAVVGAFSDITRSDRDQVADRWRSLAVNHREGLVRRAVELAELDVSMEFGRLFRVALTDASDTIRQLAVVGLWEDQRPDLVGLLLDVAEGDASHDVRAQAVVTIGAQLEHRGIEDYAEDDAERLRDVLLELAGNEGDASILRRAAVEAIGGLGDDDGATDVIRFAATDDDAALQAAALYAMGTTRDSRWEPMAMKSLTSDDTDVRAAALRAVGLIGIPGAVEAVIEAASDEDDEVRLAAIAALGALGEPPATRALRLLLQDPRMDDLPAIEAALDEAALGAEPVRSDAGW